MGSLDGKVALVTGAGRGIGRAVALKLAAEGAAVFVNDLDAEPMGEVMHEIREQGGRAAGLAGSVTAAGMADDLVQGALQSLGGLDIIVNNAGYIWNTTIQNHTDEQIQAMLDVHAAAPMKVLRAAAPHFRERHRAEQAEGRTVTRKVVNISSIAAYYGMAGGVSYAAGKGAAIGITTAMAREWGRYNVTVNAIAFGLIDTRLTQRFEAGQQASIKVGDKDHKVGFPEAMTDDLVRQIPLGRMGTPEDAAGGVYLLCTPESDYISGQILVVGGGLTTG
ncbi:SDR family NAD(P)-dependent oxidoreductase [Minwuia thermotolerans]|uniref:3-oxoacyl-ACP reductase n=1 Tax=Minwuia thermotolerans TaxID=2056226 RepID=A0A2M9G6J5_9PROT|nr:SDR family oxidoreductase [Minwuia thermotolerans]PJK31323.1 3-oxoacyl-ACP reductase [Minwuia thermotolerans]